MFKTAILTFVGTALGADLLRAKEPTNDNTYIVVLKNGLGADQAAVHADWARKHVEVGDEWTIGDFNAYKVTAMEKEGLAALLEADEVDYIQENGVVHAFQQLKCSLASNSPWGLTRTNRRESGVSDGDYVYNPDYAGNGVKAYVLDTGINLSHREFQVGNTSRAIMGANFVDGQIDDDENGHGTHCAGTIGGATYGMAKDVTLVAVKVLGRFGSGSYAGILDGIEFAVEDSANTPAVASLSLGGGYNLALNNAVDAAVEAGLTMVVASGNENQDACNVSPASAKNAITVNAMDETDRRASFSNYGRCTDIFAPGVAILSAWIGGETAVNTISGTSMACPHVAGEVAKLLSANKTLTPEQVRAALNEKASPEKIEDPRTDTPNMLLFGLDCSIVP